MKKALKKKPNIHDSSLGQIEFEHKITTDEDHLCRYYKSSKKQQKVKSIIKKNNTLKRKTTSITKPNLKR